MRPITLLACCVALLGPTCATAGTDYTGLWKGKCSYGFGVQIKLVENQLYSVSFCGPGGCFAPGRWTPNTPIEGDSKYEVISPEELRMKRKDGSYDTYVKCEADPTWIVAKPPSTDTESEKLPDCSFPATSKEEGVVIAWIT